MSQFIACTNRVVLEEFSSAINSLLSSFDCSGARQLAQDDDCSNWFCLSAKEATALVDEAHEQMKKEQFEETRLGQLLLELLRAKAEVLTWWSSDSLDCLDIVNGDERTLIDACSSQLRHFPPELYIHIRPR